MRTPSAVCRNGHRMAGENLLWHTRYTGTTKWMVRECRACANSRYRANRRAKKQNLALMEEAAAMATRRNAPDREG